MLGARVVMAGFPVFLRQTENPWEVLHHADRHPDTRPLHRSKVFYYLGEDASIINFL